MDVKQPDCNEKSLIKRLLYDNRLNIDNELKIVNHSTLKKFKLILKTKLFEPKEFTVKTSGRSLIVEAFNEETEMDHSTVVKNHLRYEHLLPKSVDPIEVKACFPLMGFLEIEARRKDVKRK